VGEVVLQLDELCGKSKPSGASLALRRGEVLGIAGLIGAGRTELLRAVFGLDPIKSGQVKVAAIRGREATMAHTNPPWLWQAGVGMLSEDRKAEGLALSMSIQDNITLSDLKSLGPLGFIGPRAQRRAATRWADVLQLKRRDVAQPIGDLSGGNQQKCAVARLLHHGADVLLLDEPTRGIDVGSKAAIYQLIDDLAAGRQGPPRAVLIVSSYFPELLGICDRIAVMSRGVLGMPRPAGQWTEHALVLASTGQDAAA
jgi:ribose transport system ATP-binding protein